MRDIAKLRENQREARELRERVDQRIEQLVGRVWVVKSAEAAELEPAIVSAFLRGYLRPGALRISQVERLVRELVPVRPR